MSSMTSVAGHMEDYSTTGVLSDNCNAPRIPQCASSAPSADSVNETSNSDYTTNCLTRWFEKPVYKRYWKHYRYMQDWFNRHHSVVHGLNNLSIHDSQRKWNPYMCSVMLSQWSRYYYDVYMRQYEMFYGMNHDEDEQWSREPSRLPAESPQSVFKKPHPVTKRRSRKRKDTHRGRSHAAKQSLKRRRQRSVSSCRSSQSRKTGSSGSQELFEMEITDEMMEFFVKSAQHKKEMAALKRKKREEEKETGDYIPLTAATGGRRTTQAPTERPGVRRTAEMKLLYGDGAAMIHGMETAMQLSYDRHFDINQPKLWPNLPLNIKF